MGGVGFKSGRLYWIQRNWGSFAGKVNSFEVSQAIFSALESATISAGSSAVIHTDVKRIPGAEFKNISFDFSGRKVTVVTSAGDAKNGGSQLTIDESVQAP